MLSFFLAIKHLNIGTRILRTKDNKAIDNDKLVHSVEEELDRSMPAQILVVILFVSTLHALSCLMRESRINEQKNVKLGTGRALKPSIRQLVGCDDADMLYINE